MEKQKISHLVNAHPVKSPVLKTIDQKIDELIDLVESSKLTETELKGVRTRLYSILPGPELDRRVMEKFEQLDSATISREEKANNLEQLLMGYKTDSRKVKRTSAAKMAASITRMIAALLLVCLGFGMIIMPAPPYFEMFTLFYINQDDGITIMDVISLFIAFAGVSLFISSLIKFNR